MRYIVFDVETPNSYNDRMSAIGMTIVDGGEVRYNIYSLINPECHFDDFNVNLTGITPQMVADKPTFAQFWREVEPILGDGVFVAHNAPFDMSVLSKCLEHYGIEYGPVVKYACTCRMSRKTMPELPNHKLNTLCDCLGIELEHHNAGSDTRACAEILLHNIKLGCDVEKFYKNYDLRIRKTVK